MRSPSIVRGSHVVRSTLHAVALAGGALAALPGSAAAQARGEMNIVGPRPERPCIFARLRNDIAEYPLRQLAKPGITGWAQINHTYDTCVEDVRTKVRYDLEYLQRQSLVEDLKIMALTVPVMIFRKGGW